LASDLKKLKVRRNGVQFKIGKETFRYLGDDTGARQWDTIYGWFNPERPEVLPCTTTKSGDGLFILERSYNVPAVDAPSDLYRSEARKIEAHNSYAQDLYRVARNSLPDQMFRGQVVDQKAAKLGRDIASKTRAITERQEGERKLERSIGAKAKRAGLGDGTAFLRRDTTAVLGSLDEFAAAQAELNQKLQNEK
jgi:hypothetical protein